MRRHAVRLPSHRHRRPGAARTNRPGDVLRCLLLARGPEWVLVDVATGSLVRSRASGWPVVATDSSLAAPSPGTGRGEHRTGPELDIVDIRLADDDEPPDPARPEAVMVMQAPERVGTPRRRAARRILHELVPADPRRPLLGSLGPSISYVDLDGSRPSVVVVPPDRPPAFSCDATGTWCQFSLGGRKHRLPVVDERLIDAKDRAPGGTLTNDAVLEAIGGPPRYLVVALGAPHRGQAPKLVLGVLPRP
ncbi:MAG: hypothetical protein ACLPUG_11940 [Acidimicrobiales bacterium]